MTWADFYLICFIVGFGLSALALLAGSVHLHLPHLHFHHGFHVPHAHGAPTGHGAGRGSNLSWFNFGTIAAFLAWFGGAGYLLERYYRVWFFLALGLATLAAYVKIGIEHAGRYGERYVPGRAQIEPVRAIASSSVAIPGQLA